MGNWFVFHVQTGKEQTACDFLNKLYKKEESVAFIPQVQIIYRNSKMSQMQLRPLFPGYVFTDSELNEKEFVTLTGRYVKFSKCIFKLLTNDTFSHIRLSYDEKNFLLGFCNNSYIVENSKGLIIGDNVYITSGPLKGRESIIQKIDRHKRRAEIKLMCFGEMKTVSVSLEIVEKL